MAANKPGTKDWQKTVNDVNLKLMYLFYDSVLMPIAHATAVQKAVKV